MERWRRHGSSNAGGNGKSNAGGNGKGKGAGASGNGTSETQVEDTDSVLGLREAGVIRPLEDVYKVAEEQLDAGCSMPSWSAT